MLSACDRKVEWESENKRAIIPKLHTVLDEAQSVPLPPGAPSQFISDFNVFRFLILLAGAAAVFFVLLRTFVDGAALSDCRSVYAVLDAARRIQTGLQIPMKTGIIPGRR